MMPHLVFGFGTYNPGDPQGRNRPNDYIAAPAAYVHTCFDEAEKRGMMPVLDLPGGYNGKGPYTTDAFTFKEPEAESAACERIADRAARGLQSAIYGGSIHPDGSGMSPDNQATQYLFAGPLYPYLKAGLTDLMCDGLADNAANLYQMSQAQKPRPLTIWGEATAERAWWWPLSAFLSPRLDLVSASRVPTICKSENLLWRDPRDKWEVDPTWGLTIWADQWRWPEAVAAYRPDLDPSPAGLAAWLLQRRRIGWHVGALQGSSAVVLAACG